LLPSVKYSTSKWLIVWSVKSGWLENTSTITSKQVCSRGPESSGSSVAGFRVLTNSSQIHGFSHNMLLISDHLGVFQPVISFIFHKSHNRVGNLDCEFLSQSKFVCFSHQDSSGHQGMQAG
jgi:hypothetical protein